MGDPGCMEQWWGTDLMIIMGEVTELEDQRWAASLPGPSDMQKPPQIQWKNRKKWQRKTKQ